MLRGNCRYQNNQAKLYLSGTQAGHEISMTEFVDEALQKRTGVFSIVERGTRFSGFWTAKPQGKKLPFFAVSDEI